MAICSKKLTKATNESIVRVTAPAKVKVSASSNRRVGHSSESLIDYQKPFKTIEEQCQLLESRGLVIENRDFAKTALEEINYYRLEGYWYSFYDKKKPAHVFVPGITFETIYKQYCFDQKLRSIIFDAISPIEVAFRTQFAYELGNAFGAFPFEKCNFRFDSESDWIESYQRLLNDVKTNAKENFVKHHIETYNQELLPIWAMVEIMSLGELSVWFDKRLQGKIKKKIASRFNVPSSIFTSWIRCISLVRNICAHHARLWNRIMPFTIIIPTKQIDKRYEGFFAFSDEYQSEKKIYNSLISIRYLLDSLSCNEIKSCFLKNISSLVADYGINEKMMGINTGKPIEEISNKLE